MAADALLNKRYKLLSPLGAGGMAMVYKAQDLSLGRLVAVKVLRDQLTNDPEFLARFQQEARSAANLQHPNIVTVHDFGRDGGRYYIVMEYIEGQDLKGLIKAQGGPFPVAQALDLFIQMCAGIGYAHRAGLVHCDVKPQNMLVTPDGRLKVTDFGIARAFVARAPGETTDVVWGSPQYYSPEQAAGESPSPASDVYSLGVVMYEMLAGRLPFVAATQPALAMMHLREEPPNIALFNPAIPEALAIIVHKVLAKEPSARYRTADQLGRILISYREHGDELTGALETNTPAHGAAHAPAAPQRTADPAPLFRFPERRARPAPEPPPVYDAPVLTQPHIPVNGDAYAREGLDWVAVGLGFMAFVMVAGLLPLWAYVYTVYTR
jgi:serine/threonine-protein kinase